MSRKREIQLLRKDYHVKHKRVFKVWIYFFAMFSFLLSQSAKHVYTQHPHNWYDITGRIDVLLLAFSIAISLISFIVKVNITWVESFLDIKKPTIVTLISLLFPFFLLAVSLTVNFPLYVTPGVCSFIVFIVMTYQAKKR